MSANKFKPHVHVLPEDDANRQIAVGFHNHLALKQPRNLEILPPASGWARARDKLRDVHVPEMRKYPERNLVLLIDFDATAGRRAHMMAVVPADLQDRVFVLGVFSEPEKLKQALGSFEKIGGLLADECATGAVGAWGHLLLAHNAAESTRLMARTRQILF